MTRFKVSGMSCDHCVKAVTRAIQDVSPKAAVSVDLKQGLVDVQSELAPAQLVSVIEDAGYTVTEVQK
jgi:copper chaperone